MSHSRFVVVGGGFAGLAAVHRLLLAGARPVLISSGVGASAMTSGAADLRPWMDEVRGDVTAEARAFVADLGLYGGPGRVATSEGLVRPTDGVGARVLRLERFSGKTVGIIGWRRADFDPELLARSLSSSLFARNTGTRFVVVDVPGVVSEQELSFPLAALVRLFDEDKRVAALTSAVHRLSSSTQGLLVGPWLGEALNELEAPDCPIGETLGPPEGAFGARFHKSVSSWQARNELEVRHARVSQISVEEDRFCVRLAAAHSGSQKEDATLWADGVVLATGGLIGRGVSLASVGDAPAALRASLDPAGITASGAKEGWDGANDGGRWVRPPHGSTWGAPRKGLVWAGDARSSVHRAAPGGTVFGAVQSGLDAAEALLALRS